MPRPGWKARPGRGSTVELDVDVCVIGAGLAGLTVAREVARLGWSVVVLEAQSVAWSASGRNTGVVLPGFAVGADALIERVGLEQAKALWSRSEAGAEYVRNAARDMPGTALIRKRLAARVENRRHRAHGARGRAHGRRIRRGGRAMAGRPGARGVAFAALFPRAALSARLLPASAQLCARSRRRGGSRRRAHLRGYAGAGDRSGGRAQARRHPAFARPRGACGARRQRAYGRARSAIRQHAVADLQHDDHHRAARRRAAEAIRYPGAVSDARSRPVTTIASWTAGG